MFNFLRTKPEPPPKQEVPRMKLLIFIDRFNVLRMYYKESTRLVHKVWTKGEWMTDDTDYPSIEAVYDIRKHSDTILYKE